jgi:hypothetical protein
LLPSSYASLATFALGGDPPVNGSSENKPDWYGFETDNACLDKPALDEKLASGEFKIIGTGLDMLTNNEAQALIASRSGRVVDYAAYAKQRVQLFIASSTEAYIMDAYVYADIGTKKIVHIAARLRTAQSSSSTIHNFKAYQGGPISFLPPQ